MVGAWCCSSMEPVYDAFWFLVSHPVLVFGSLSYLDEQFWCTCDRAFFANESVNVPRGVECNAAPNQSHPSILAAVAADILAVGKQLGDTFEQFRVPCRKVVSPTKKMCRTLKQILRNHRLLLRRDRKTQVQWKLITLTTSIIRRPSMVSRNRPRQAKLGSSLNMGRFNGL